LLDLLVDVAEIVYVAEGLARTSVLAKEHSEDDFTLVSLLGQPQLKTGQLQVTHKSYVIH
jgi:hypothetical protein